MLFAVALLNACSNSNNKSATASKTDSLANTAPVKPASENVIAQFWAGTHDSIKNANHKEWNKYAASLDSSFSRLTRKKFNVMQNWAQQELKDYQYDSLTLFYPFSGPDFFYANLLFPKAKKYIMVGLEPVGYAPTPALMPDSVLNNYLNEVENSLYAIFNFGFFRTNAMRENFNKENLNGMLPLLYLFIERRGYDIITVNKVRLGMNGEVNTFPVSDNDSTPNLKKIVRGVRFIIKSKSNAQTQELYYFSFDLSNSNYRKHPEFEKFVKQQLPYCVYLKAASCLMHKTYFSDIRNLILNNAGMVLQDDSGIPVHFFRNQNWDLQLYGKYNGVIKLFKGDEQPDLIEQYKRDSIKVKPLPFGTGYKFNKGTSNLQLAKRVH